MTATADALMAIFGFKRVEGKQMKTKNDGGPAFPHSRLGSDHDGMTLRDYFAAKAMQGLCAHPEMGHNPYVKIAEAAYHQADAMLAERESQQ